MTHKKILAIDQGEFVGGAERFLAELLTRVTDEYEVHLVSTGNPDHLKLYEGSKMTHHQMTMPSLGITNFWQLFSARRSFHKMSQQIQPDIIISNTVRTHLITSKRGVSIPLIWMAHDRTFPKWLLKRMINIPKRIIACSEYVKKWYEDRAEVLTPYGIEEELFTQLQSSKKKPVIGMVGNIVPWKGQKVFIEAAKKVHEHFPDWAFEIIGKPYHGNAESEAYFSECQQLTKDLEYITWKTSDQAAKDLGEWKILVHCSTNPEPLGRVVLEGMAAGCAVIASELGGPPEMIGEDRGITIKPNKEALQEALEKLLSDEDLLKNYAHKGQQYIEEHFFWEKVIKRFKKFLIFTS